MIHSVIRQLLQIINVVLDEFDGVFHDGGKVHVVSTWFVLSENYVAIGTTKGDQNTDAHGITIVESLVVDLSFRSNGSTDSPCGVPLSPSREFRHGLCGAQECRGVRRLC
jgi:hypothetical protein